MIASGSKISITFAKPRPKFSRKSSFHLLPTSLSNFLQFRVRVQFCMLV